LSHATPKDTTKYAAQHSVLAQAGHFRDFLGLKVSSLGIGTYLGGQNEADDQAYLQALKTALTSGINLVDSAINYRCMRSERMIGQALLELADEQKMGREEVVLCTKGGFIPFDGAPPADPSRYLFEEYLRPGFCREEDVVAGCHCMAPAYLRDQVSRSLKNLRLTTIDLYYLHNPEMQLDEVPRDEFLLRLEKAFGALEEMVKEGKIKAYGTATWNAFRVALGAQDYVSFQDVLRTAERAGGSSHHFKAVQLPFNLGMAEAWGSANQVLGSQTVPLLEAAKANGIAVFTSASILQGRLSRNLPSQVAEVFPELSTNAQRALQFVRSTPGVTAALVGMKNKAHVEENLKVASVPPAPASKLESLFSGK